MSQGRVDAIRPARAVSGGLATAAYLASLAP